MPIILFSAALIWWACGLLGIVHWSYHLQYDPEFFEFSEIWKSFFVVIIFYFCGGALLGMVLAWWTVRRRRGKTKFFMFAVLAALLWATTIRAQPRSPDCGEAIRRLEESNVAYDAHERGLLGKIKIDEPPGDRFSPQSNQLAWWGKFDKPFEYWGNPDLAASWFDPEGQKVASIEVDAEQCKLAKAVLRQEGFQPGIWRVDVNCRDGTLLDQKQFAVGYPPTLPADVQAAGVLNNDDSRRISVS